MRHCASPPRRLNTLVKPLACSLRVRVVELTPRLAVDDQQLLLELLQRLGRMFVLAGIEMLCAGDVAGGKGRGIAQVVHMRALVHQLDGFLRLHRGVAQLARAQLEHQHGQQQRQR